MKFFTIPPKKYTDFMAINDNYFCLAPLCENVDYFNYFKDKAAQGKHVILDNGAAEGRMMNGKDYIHLIMDLKPTEAVAPDVLNDCERTLMELNKFKHDLQSLQNLDGSWGKVKILGVPQGSTPAKYLKSYLAMLEDPFIHTLGISKFAVKAFSQVTDLDDVANNRIECISMLNKYGLDTKPLHCLGMRNPAEFKAYEYIPSVRSCDSSFPVLAATLDKKLGHCPFDINTPYSYFEEELTMKQYQLAISNIHELNRYYKLEV